jgi:hypothetical protein
VRNRLRSLGLLLTVALAAACPKVDPTPLDAGLAPECDTRAECDPGEICNAEKRCAGCDSSGQCRLKETCNPTSLLCELRSGWGTECATHEQCQAGFWCKQGLCQERSEVSLCAGGDSTTCKQGERCHPLNEICEADLGCTEDADCGGGELCNTGSNACVPRCTVDTQASVCAAGERCVSEKCVQCEADADCGPGLKCDPAGKCGAGDRCYQDRQCKVPLVCHVPTGACVSAQPPCVSDESCAADQRCQVDTGKCVARDCQPDPYEPNNEAPQAFGAQAQRYTDLTLCLNDVDQFKLNLNRGDQLGVNLDADPFAENAFATLVKDASGRTVASGKLLASFVAPAAATYYVVISCTDPYQPYDATFLLSRGSPCDDDGYEPNDLPAQATAANSSSLLDGRICPQDQDHFRFAVPASQGVRISLVNYDSGSGLLRLCLIDGNTSLGCSEETAPVVTATSTQVAGKTLIGRVLGSSERTANSYTLKVEFL